MGLLGALAKTVVFAVPVSATFFDQVGTVVSVEGVSMQPVLNPEERGRRRRTDFVFLSRLSVHALQFQRGEVVSLVSPSNPSQRYIKRIVALEGDTVHAQDRRRVVVPAGHCWVEGDHHGRSVDSNVFGPISLGLITAKATHVVWPPHRWGRLEVQPPDGKRVYRDRSRKKGVGSLTLTAEDGASS